MPGEPPPSVLMTVQTAGAAPTLAQAADQLALKLEDLDHDYGVVPIDPVRGLFSVLARGDVAQSEGAQSEVAQSEGLAEGVFQGPWSNPAIAPYGPPEDDPVR